MCFSHSAIVFVLWNCAGLFPRQFMYSVLFPGFHSSFPCSRSCIFICPYQWLLVTFLCIFYFGSDFPFRLVFGSRLPCRGGGGSILRAFFISSVFFLSLRYFVSIRTLLPLHWLLMLGCLGLSVVFCPCWVCFSLRCALCPCFLFRCRGLQVGLRLILGGLF